MTTTTAISLILGGLSSGGSPTDQGDLSVIIPGGGSPTDQGFVSLQFPIGGSPTDQGDPPPGPITREVAVGNLVTFSEIIAARLALNVVSGNTVNFAEATEDATKYADTLTFISFSQVVQAVRVLNASVANLITFGQKAQRTYEESVAHTITFASATARKITSENFITFSQQVVADVSKLVGNTVTFDSSVATTKILNISISNLITFSSFVVAANNRTCDKSQFASLCLPPVAFTQRDTILMVCDMDTIELRNPELGNSETIDPKRAMNETRYGKLTMYRNPIWPKKTTLEFDLTAITKLKALELHDFLFNCLGREITLTDHESRIWLGVITNPETLINELSDDDCNYSSNLVFEGEPQ
jgi:hypothetical protein